MKTVSAASIAAALVLASSAAALAQSSGGGASGGAAGGATGGIGSSMGTSGAPPSTSPNSIPTVGGWSPPMAPGQHLNNSLTNGSGMSGSTGSGTSSDNPVAGTEEVPGNGIGPNPPNIDSSVGSSSSSSGTGQ